MLRVVMLLLLFVPGAVADDWPQWRGPQRDAASREVGLRQVWPAEGPPLAWRAVGVGAGYSSVVVSQGKVFTIGKSGEDVLVSALDSETGQLAWRKKIGTTARDPSSTPTVDEDRLYALDPDGELVCLAADSGKLLWQRSFLQDFGGRMMSGRGYGESPLIDGERLICTPGGPDAALVALDKRSGDVIWKTTLPEIGKAGRDGAGFSSVVVSEGAGTRQYVQLVGRGVIGVDAQDGRFLWGYNAIANETANIPTPIVRDDWVFVANGYGVGSVLLRLLPENQGNPKARGVKAQEIYRLTGSQFQNHHGGVVLRGDRLYGGHGSNNGLPTCLDFETGRVIWKRRGPGMGSAAVVYADGFLYFRYQNGVVALVEASDRGYHVTGTFTIPGAGGDSWSHPVVAGGRLFLREQDVLWVYNLRATPATTSPTPSAEALTSRVTDRRLYSYVASLEGSVSASNSRSGNVRSELPFVRLADEHLTSAGTIREEKLRLLRELPMPCILDLAGTQVADAGLMQLGECPHIACVNLELCARITDAGLQAIGRLKQLRMLVLSGTGITEVGIRNLVPSQHLIALDLEGCDGITDAACGALGEMVRLRALVLKKTGFERKSVTDEGLRQLTNLTELEVLDLDGNKVTDAGLAHLERLTKLRELHLSLLAVTDRGMIYLQPLKELRHLELLYSVGFAGPKITGEGLTFLKPLANLQSLNLTGARLADADLRQLAALRNLKTLQLTRTTVSAEAIRNLQAALPECEVTN